MNLTYISNLEYKVSKHCHWVDDAFAQMTFTPWAWHGKGIQIALFPSHFPRCFSELITLKSVSWGYFSGFCHCNLKVDWVIHLSTWTLIYSCLCISLSHALWWKLKSPNPMYKVCVQKHIPNIVLGVSQFMCQINPGEQMSTFPTWQIPSTSSFSSNVWVGTVTFRWCWVHWAPSLQVKADMWQGLFTLMLWRACPCDLGAYPLCQSPSTAAPACSS